jgi:hypothetical protein
MTVRTMKSCDQHICDREHCRSYRNAYERWLMFKDTKWLSQNLALLAEEEGWAQMLQADGARLEWSFRSPEKPTPEEKG